MGKWMRFSFVLGMVFAIGTSLWAQGGAVTAGAPVIQVEFTNEKLQPSHWLMKLHPDGSGEFESDGGVIAGKDANRIVAGDVSRPIQLSQPFVDKVFSTARSRRYFAYPCEGHMKVAFQGTKKLSYMGPEGSGSCEFNYSKDKEIQALSESFLSIESTLLFGARLEKMLQHDRLGLDQELEGLVAAAHDGSAIELGVISDTLNKIAADEQVMERARKKARMLLAQASGPVRS